MKALVVLSGGQDSTTCLYWAKQRYKEVHAVTFDYGQRHQQEIESAQKIGHLAGIDRDHHELIVIPQILKGSSPLVSGAPLEQYKDHRSLPGGLEKTFVPMRNQLFLTIAANRAVTIGTNSIITGVCEEDYGGYPDCRRVFIDRLQDAINLGLHGKTIDFRDDGPMIFIETPLMHLTKKKTVELAFDLPGCYAALAWTHTAYDGQYPPVGHDHATLLRAKGFEEAGLPDPLVLRAWHDKLMELPHTSNYSEEGLARAGLYFAGSPVDEVGCV